MSTAQAARVMDAARRIRQAAERAGLDFPEVAGVGDVEHTVAYLESAAGFIEAHVTPVTGAAGGSAKRRK